MTMTMTGVILSIVISGVIALFITHRFLRERMGAGLAVMFLLPLLGCGLYVYLTKPPTAAEPLQAPAYTPATQEDVEALSKTLEAAPDDLGSVIAMAEAYMSRDEYDEAITMLKSKEQNFPQGELTVQIAKAYFAKGLLFAEQGRFDEALKTLRTAREVSPESAPFLPDLDHFIRMIENRMAKE